MDKNTLGNYGRVIVCVLIICAMIALASPFGNYIKDTIWDITGMLSGTEVSDDDAIGVVDSNNTITLKGTLPADTYTLKYENESGVMTEYSEICTLEITDSGENAVYEGLIAENSAPVGASAIGVYNSADERVGEFGLGSLAAKGLGEKLYSFGAISDTHVGANTGEDDLKNALTYFENETDVQFIANCGDLSLSGTDANLALYKNIVDNYTTKRVYEVTGNHEASRRYTSVDAMQQYTGEDLYYSFTNGDDVYIMVGLGYVSDITQHTFFDGELEWLYETLEANRNKRCFVFFHLFPSDGSGDAVDMDVAGELMNNTQGEFFYNLMSHYSNVTWFHGHSHQSFVIQETNEMNTYDKIFGSHSVHIPSLAYPKNITDGSLVNNYNGSEGYVVDVYENDIVLKGRDFVTGKFLPIATYSLDTTKKNIEAETYYDPLQLIVNKNSNILKTTTDWYAGSVNKNTITEVTFTDSYSATGYDECWDASISGNDQVMAYRSGTKVTVVGNKNGILANANSSKLFDGFTKLEKINGLDKLNTSNITDFQLVFNDCKALTNVDISSFDLTKAAKLNGLFKGCTSLTSFKLPTEINTIRGNSLTNISQLFEDCKSLKEVDLTYLVQNKQYYFSGTFKGCSALEKVNISGFKTKVFVNTFYGCSAVKEIDLSNANFAECDSMLNGFRGCTNLTTLKLPDVMNTAKVESMVNTFYGCQNLTLDCSGWSTAKCKDVTDFNYNAPGVIAPVLN